jgi:hypothetical protein
MDTPQAYTIKTFCAAFGISRSLAYREIAAGRLDARKIGNRTVILRNEAERWASALPGARSA